MQSFNTFYLHIGTHSKVLLIIQNLKIDGKLKTNITTNVII